MTRAHTRLRSELGASSVEAALVFPVLMLVFFAVIQGAATLHSGNVAQASAQAAFESARLYDGSLETALEVGYATAAAAGHALTDVDVVIDITATTVAVTVRGSAPSLVPGMPVAVERTVTGPRERWSS